MYQKLLILILILLLFVGTQVNAQTGAGVALSVSPPLFDLDVFLGETVEQKITVTNQSDVAVPILARVVDFTAEDETGEMNFEEERSAYDSARFWFELQSPSFILQPKESKVVNFKISVPKDVQPGGYYSAIFFEPQLPSFYFREGQPKAILIVGSLFLISAKTLTLEPVSSANPIEIAEFRIPKEKRLQVLENALASVSQVIPGVSAAEISIVEKPPSSFVLRLKNNDIYHHKLSGKLLIYNPFGKKIGETEIKRTSILPGKTRQFTVDVSDVSLGAGFLENLKYLPSPISNFLAQIVSFGRYRAVLELGETKSQIEINETLNFWTFPWKIISPLLFILIFLIFIRRRILAALKVLFTRSS